MTLGSAAEIKLVLESEVVENMNIIVSVFITFSTPFAYAATSQESLISVACLVH